MPLKNLDHIFRPRRVAVVGASDRQGSVGYTVLKNLREGGFKGELYAVNPHREQVQNLPAFRTIGELPDRPDLAVLCTPADTIAPLVEQCAAADVRGVVILAAGFREVGERGRTREKRLREIIASTPSLRVVGPNCLGLIAPHHGLNASFATTSLPPGRVAFVSQSGAI
ncbi:MAG: CoA-binding protein, partial [Planctomycetales bacterium]|nr:CoA-binding protein [Planctomycetales bacterium]